MVRWVFLAILVGVTALKVHFYTPETEKYTQGQKIKITTTVLDKNNLAVTGIKINSPKNVNYVIGDVLQIIGTYDIQVIEEDWTIYSLDEVEIMVVGSEKSFRVLMAGTRAKVISLLVNWLPGDIGALAAGILVGGDSVMSGESVNSFRRVGLSHIVAASGYNVTVVSGWTMVILSGLFNRFVVIYIGILSIILYMFLAGGSAAVVRAGLLVIAVNLGKIVGRESDSGWLLLVTSLVMLIVSPAWAWDIGFQLSVAAMVGLIYFGGKSVWSQTLACQITTLPLILHYFGNLSVIAPLANLFLLWPVGVIMPVLAIASTVGMLYSVWGGYIAIASWPFLKIVTEGVNIFASADWASLTVDKMSWGWVGAFYLVLLIIKLKLMKNE